MSASSFLSVIFIFQTQGLVRVTFLFLFYFFTNACVAQKDMHNLLDCTPLGLEPGSDISEEKGRLKTIYCMLITMNMFLPDLETVLHLDLLKPSFSDTFHFPNIG